MNLLKVISGWWNGFFDKRLWSPVGGRKTVSREDVSEETALNYSAVWCATRLLCGTAASMPFPVYRGLVDEDRKKERSHPVHRLLNMKPNRDTTALNFRSVMWQWQINWGNAYAEIEREGGDPDGEIVGLWPLHPSRVKPCVDEFDELYYEVSMPDRDDVNLEPWRVFHVPSIITHDGLVGRGVIQHARESIGAGIAAEKYGAHWFGGAAVPRAVVEHPGVWKPEARDAFRDEWDDIYSGPDGHRVALLMGGAQMKPLSISAEDSQFLQTRQFGVEEIARWYGVPPHLLQHLLRATFNNIEHLGISFVQYSLIPWLRVWEQCVSDKLLRDGERDELFAEHTVDALLRGDTAARASFYQTMTGSALMTRNECRKKENLPPVAGGDTFLVQGAMVPLDEDGKPVSEFAGAAEEPDPMDDEEPEPPDNGMSAKLGRVLERHLNWLLTKETKRMLSVAKRPDEFLSLVDDFYAEHAAFVRDAVTDTLDALEACGVAVEHDAFVSGWIGEGRSAMLEAASATPEKLAESVALTVESETWSRRPTRSVEHLCERASDATVVV